MPSSSFGSELVDAIRAHLKANRINSLGKLKDAAVVIARIADELYAKKLPKRAARTVFVPPTPDEVSAYGREIGYPLDGEDFCAHYEKKDWKVSGSTKMSKWKAAVKQWKSHGWGILLRSDGSSSLVEVVGWRFYLKELQAQGRWQKPIPETWDELDRPDRAMIHSQRKYVSNLNDFASKHPAEFAERLKNEEDKRG